MAKLRVELVSPERAVWVGEADSVTAKTIEGELGVRPGHAPVLGVLVDGSSVTIRPSGGGDVVKAAVVGGGFFSVADDEVSLLAESAELGPEIDVYAVRHALENILALGAERDDQTAAAERRAKARLSAAGQEA